MDEMSLELAKSAHLTIAQSLSLIALSAQVSLHVLDFAATF